MSKRKSELNFRYTPLGDEAVVKWLIENRAAVMSELEYGLMDEDIVLTYIDLDDVLGKVKLSAGERDTVELVMQGYTMADITILRGGQRQAYGVFYKRAIRKICQ